MKKVIYYILFSISIIGIPLFAFGIINTMVSIKYETNNQGDCISLISGQDLCFTIKVLQGLIVTCVVGIIALMILRKKILKK